MVLLVPLVALKCHRDTKRTIFPVPLAQKNHFPRPPGSREEI